MKRQVYRLPKAGSLKKLNLEEEDLKSPENHEVRLEIKSIGLNFADIFAIQGLYSATPKGSFVPGLEYSGVVESVGEKVRRVKPGDKVMGITRFGAYASHLKIHEDYLAPLPSGWNFEQGAAFLVQGLTAWYGLSELGSVQKGQWVMIHSAAGGVGILANRICQKLGAHSIGTVSTKEKVEFLKQHESYDEVIIRDKNFYKSLKESLKDKKLDLIMECIGGEVLKQGWEVLAPRGRMIVYGSADFAGNSNAPNYFRLMLKYLRRPKIDPMKMIQTNKGMLGFNLIYLYEEKALFHKMLQQLMGLDLEPQHIGHRFTFADMYQALRFFQSGKSQGKVVVNI